MGKALKRGTRRTFCPKRKEKKEKILKKEEKEELDSLLRRQNLFLISLKLITNEQISTAQNWLPLSKFNVNVWACSGESRFPRSGWTQACILPNFPKKKPYEIENSWVCRGCAQGVPSGYASVIGVYQNPC